VYCATPTAIELEFRGSEPIMVLMKEIVGRNICNSAVRLFMWKWWRQEAAT